MKKGYIGNAKIISAADLPKITDAHKDIKSLVCVDVRIVEFREEYIIYSVRYCEKDSLHLLDDFYIDCCVYSYAVPKFKNQ